jgi:uncharacterized protein (DUF2249 family)
LNGIISKVDYFAHFFVLRFERILWKWEIFWAHCMGIIDDHSTMSLMTNHYWTKLQENMLDTIFSRAFELCCSEVGSTYWKIENIISERHAAHCTSAISCSLLWSPDRTTRGWVYSRSWCVILPSNKIHIKCGSCFNFAAVMRKGNNSQHLTVSANRYKHQNVW